MVRGSSPCAVAKKAVVVVAQLAVVALHRRFVLLAALPAEVVEVCRPPRSGLRRERQPPF